MRGMIVFLAVVCMAFSAGGAIYGVVFEDTDADGYFDNDEEGAWKVDVLLKDALTDDLLETYETEYNGSYLFEDLDGGVYKVEVDLPEHYSSSTASSKTISISGDAAGLDFGIYSIYGKIIGVVYLDEDKNGEKEGSEEGIEGVNVTLFRDSDEMETAETDSNGNFEFRDLDVDSYLVKCDEFGDYEFTTETEDEVFVSEREVEHVEFGMYIEPEELFSNITVIVFADNNFTGQRESGERGLFDVLVKLYDKDLRTVALARTDKNGMGKFKELKEGIYRLEEFDPTGFESTTPNEITVVLKRGTAETVYFGDASPSAVKAREAEEQEEQPEVIAPAELPEPVQPAEVVEENETEINQTIEEITLTDITNTTKMPVEEPKQEEQFPVLIPVALFIILAAVIWYFISNRKKPPKRQGLPGL